MKFLICFLFAAFTSIPVLAGSVVTGFDGYLATNVTTTIGSAATASATIPMKGFTLVGVFIPSAFTGSSISFQAGTTATGTFVPVTSGTAGTSLSYAVGTSRYVAIDPKDFYGINFLKIVSGSSEADARTLTCQMKGF